MILFSRVLVPVSIVAICTGIVAVIIAGPWALAYILLFVLATLPGWPLGRVLFGRHPAGWQLDDSILRARLRVHGPRGLGQ